MSLNWRNNRKFDYFSPKLSYFNTSMVVSIDFIKISIKSTRSIGILRGPAYTVGGLNAVNEGLFIQPRFVGNWLYIL